MKELIYIVSICSLFSLLGCKSKEQKFLDNHKVILYETKEAGDFINTANIKPDEAKQIQAAFAIKNNKKPESYNLFIIDNNYVFTSYFHPKVPEASTSGIWIDAKTGNAKYMETGIWLRAYKPYLENDDTFPF
ncbi:hypothetical protein NK356_10030 [Chryseobacterium sp. S0630]|uniref:hypothetical protein n=1 Tax=Chryseobacterium sp. S0630 TaxID=2957803 RepID=UPI0012E0431F|nr:hypothetical protein [Chryseobacterium sp. S0630]MCP1299506.1 hypothetical protein [Chryseobacterium sp. S0630]